MRETIHQVLLLAVSLPLPDPLPLPEPPVDPEPVLDLEPDPDPEPDPVPVVEPLEPLEPLPLLVVFPLFFFFLFFPLAVVEEEVDPGLPVVPVFPPGLLPPGCAAAAGICAGSRSGLSAISLPPLVMSLLPLFGVAPKTVLLCFFLRNPWTFRPGSARIRLYLRMASLTRKRISLCCPGKRSAMDISVWVKDPEPLPPSFPLAFPFFRDW